MMKDDGMSLCLYILSTIADIMIIVVFATLAIIFNNFWIIFLSILFMVLVEPATTFKKRKDKENGKSTSNNRFYL